MWCVLAAAFAASAINTQEADEYSRSVRERWLDHSQPEISRIDIFSTRNQLLNSIGDLIVESFHFSGLRVTYDNGVVSGTLAQKLAVLINTLKKKLAVLIRTLS